MDNKYCRCTHNLQSITLNMGSGRLDCIPLVLILFVGIWVSEGFWSALLAGFLGCLAIVLLFGIGSGTEVRKFGHKYTLTCDKCGYDNLEITEHTDLGVVTRCKRCGQICHHILNH